MLLLGFMSLLVVVVHLVWQMQQLQQRMTQVHARLATLEHAAIQRRLSSLTPTERFGDAVV